MLVCRVMSSNKSTDTSPENLLKRAHSLKSEAQTKALYSDWANTYDQTMIDGLGYESPQKVAKLLELNVPDKSAKILDVGTGTGLVGKELAALGFINIDGIDYSAPMLEIAAQCGAYNNLLEADLNEPIGIENAKYDALVCVGTFTHGHVGAECLDELFRIIKPGGQFVTAIRKTYWRPAGFAQKIEQLIADGIVKIVYREEDSNYVYSQEAESWFMVWQKL